MREQHTKKKKLVIVLSVLIVMLIVGAFVVTVSPPLSVRREWTGISLHALSLDETRLVVESGSGWIRIDISPHFGVDVENARTSNLSILGILGSWMFNKSTIFTLEDWHGNVTYYVSQYADCVDAWEIWNEPVNPNPNWTLLGLDVSSQENMSRIVQFYYSMVQEASPIIRQYDQSAEIVLFGGLTLWSGGDANLALDKAFAEQFAATNITQYGDAFSVHAYPWEERNMSRVFERYTVSLAYYRGLFPSLDVWVTETGCPVEDYGVDGQAQYLRDVLPYFEGKAERFFWYSLLDNADDGGLFGLVENGVPRPAYYSLQGPLTGK